MADTVRLLLIARAGALAEGLSGLLRTIPSVEILGPVDDLPSALLATSGLCPAAVLLDSRPFAERIPAAVGGLRTLLPHAKCIVLADSVRQQQAAEDAGADAVLLKGCRPIQLLATVRSLLATSPALQ